jgi:hypothetical protein
MRTSVVFSTGLNIYMRLARFPIALASIVMLAPAHAQQSLIQQVPRHEFRNDMRTVGTVDLPAQEWAATIDSLSRILQQPIAALVPGKWKPVHLRGTRTEVLQKIAQLTNARWYKWHNTLCLCPDIVPEQLRLNMANAKVRPTTAVTDPDMRFFASLTPVQLDNFARGEAIAVKSLSSQQWNFLVEIGRSTPLFGKALPRYKEASLIAYIEPMAMSFWRSMLLEDATEPPKQNRGQPQGFTSTFTSLRDAAYPQWVMLESLAQAALNNNQPITLPRTRIFSPTQFDVFPHGVLKARAVVMQAGLYSAFVASSGTWTPQVLLTLAQAATRTELRTVGETLFFAVSPGINMMPKDEASLQEIIELEENWRALTPMLQEVALMPRSVTAPLPAKWLSDPRLVAHHELSQEQQTWLQSTPEQLPLWMQQPEYLKDVEICTIPWLVLEFTLPDKPQQRLPWRTTAPHNYVWAALHTAAKNQPVQP